MESSSARAMPGKRHEIVVIGSGYGGAVAASRLARAGRQVCVLERGKAFRPGDFPADQAGLAAETRLSGSGASHGARDALYALHVDDAVAVVSACGLGGGSLINGNAVLRAEQRVLEDPCWPAELQNDDDHLLELGYERALAMLTPATYPANLPVLPKMQALHSAAEAIGGKFYRLPLTVAFTDGRNPVGIEQQACRLCGNCLSGCNYAAMNTLALNYLPDARHHGAMLCTGIDVAWIERDNRLWRVHYRRDGALDSVEADIVILAAGALGSTEILLRSRAHGLALSDQLGNRFSGNGAQLAFIRGAAQAVDGIGWTQPDGPAVGPCSTGVIDLREATVLEQGAILQDGAVPGALSALLAEALGPKNHTLALLGRGYDDAGGRMSLQQDRLSVHWPGPAGPAAALERRLREAAQRLGGESRPQPQLGATLQRKPLITDPLGGCAMASDAAFGVVNHKGQVFRAAAGNAVHEGLYVCDGAVIPRALGVGPLLTISALAERTVALLAKGHGWDIDYSLPHAAPGVGTQPAVGLRFTETMKGFLAEHAAERQDAGRQGPPGRSPLAFTLTVISEDVDAMLANPPHRALLSGHVDAPLLSPYLLTVSAGELRFLKPAPEHPSAKRMHYRMLLSADDGRRFIFDGYKEISKGSVLKLWNEANTLHYELYQGETATGDPLARGTLHSDAADLARQLSSLHILNARDGAHKLATAVRVGRFFAGELFDTYGGPLSKWLGRLG